MEVFGAFLEEDWESLSKMFSFEDSNHFLPHCDANNVFSNHDIIPSGEIPCGALENANNFYCVSQESSNSTEFESALFTNGENHHFQGGNNFLHGEKNNTFEPMDFFCPVFSDDMMEEILQLKADTWNEKLGNAEIQTPENNGDSCLKRKYEKPEIHAQDDDSSESPKKKPRSKKNKKTIEISNDEDLNNAGGNGQSSSTCSSEEDDFNGSDSKVSASNAKSKAGKGPATDAQSLYARKRRERINERLRILQNLVPNGTKVDISTMLEEAVHYVKFLQLQIKLLSSDDLWMYAPIAYNGMDMGLYQKIVPNLFC
ncbi:hypothetical protein DH2020_008266 [Rehmannia glutinosa]|uniref:BHLH domain-containing protein n=1 Tax=Rehmannia glutinosa TaxID=99300 RepID=A0ABR0U0T2_REHGL